MPLTEREWFIEAPWGRICIVAWGNSLDPPVLLCHGAVDTAASFLPLVKLLPEKFYYVAMELPGNGKSDPLPPGLMISVYDLVYPLHAVVKHFRWREFSCIAHSISVTVCKLYNLSYPGIMKKVVEIDPLTVDVTPPEQFANWYNKYFDKYFADYDKINAPKKSAPKYTWRQAVEMLMSARDIDERAAAATLGRMSEPAGDGLIRITADNRYKHHRVTRPPFSPKLYKKIITACPATTLAIIAEGSIATGYYPHAHYIMDEKIQNYKSIKVAGGHNLHVSNPERISGVIGQFLIYGLEGLEKKAKL